MLLFSDAFPKQSVQAARALLKSPHLEHFFATPSEEWYSTKRGFSTGWASIIAEELGVSGLTTAAIKGTDGGNNTTLYAC